MKLTFAVLLLSTTLAQAQIGPKLEFKSTEDIRKCSEYYRYELGLCLDALKQYSENNPKKMLEIAKATRLAFSSSTALPYFAKAMERDGNNKICDDEDFQTSLFAAFLQQSAESEFFKLGKKLLEKDCLDRIKPALEKELSANDPDEDLVSIGCPIMKAAGKNLANCAPKPVEKAVEAAPEKLPKLDKKSMKLETVKVYQGPEGVIVKMADIKGQPNMMLIHFSGIKGPWNNKSLLHKRHDNNTSGTSYDLWTEHEGSTWTSVAARNCSQGYCRYTSSVPEMKDELGLYYNQEESKKAKSDSILKAYNP